MTFKKLQSEVKGNSFYISADHRREYLAALEVGLTKTVRAMRIHAAALEDDLLRPGVLQDLEALRPALRARRRRAEIEERLSSLNAEATLVAAVPLKLEPATSVSGASGDVAPRLESTLVVDQAQDVSPL